MSNIFDIFNNNAQQQAANAQIGGIQQGQAQANQYFGQGANSLNQNYTAGLQPYLQNYGQAQQGANAYGNALGLNGPAGSAAAVQAFQANPGYNFQLNQGNNAVLAKQAQTGNLSSGATDMALQNYAQGTANQGYNQYVQNLQPYLGQENQAASGIGNMYSGLGNQLSNLYQNQGNMNYGADTSIGNANANAAMGNLTGSQNLWGFGMGAANLGAKLFGMSDGYMKDDIEKVGELYDGQNVYRYRFKGSPKHEIGLIAQEVEQRYPEAVREFSGIRHVNYDLATRPAAGYAQRLLKFAA
jgi:hypothetical protein